VGVLVRVFEPGRVRVPVGMGLAVMGVLVLVLDVRMVVFDVRVHV
jgi:hypothetical protein